MSDFLSRLITATFEPAATVRPRPIARFEPVGAALPVWPREMEPPAPSRERDVQTDALAALDEPDVSSRPARPEPDAATARDLPPRRPSRQAAARQREVNAADQMPQHPPSPATPLPPDLGGPSPLEPPDERLAESTGAEEQQPAPRALPTGDMQDSDAGRAPASRLDRPRRSLPARRGEGTAQGERPTPPARAATPMPQASYRDERTGSPTGLTVPAPPRSETAQPSALLAENSHRAARPEVAGERASPPAQPASLSLADRLAADRRGGPPPTPTPAAAERGPETPPTIRVTIGRIEVKAAASSQTKPTAQRSRPPKPGLSLDQYLQQRNGGKP